MAGRNFKGELQEYCQKNHFPIPVYEHTLCGDLNFNQYQSTLTIGGVFANAETSELMRITSNIASNKKAADQSAADRMMTFMKIPRTSNPSSAVYQPPTATYIHGVPTPSPYGPAAAGYTMVKVEKDDTGMSKVAITSHTAPITAIKQEHHQYQYQQPQQWDGNVDENHYSPSIDGSGYGGIDNYNTSSSISTSCNPSVLADSTNRQTSLFKGKGSDHPRVEPSAVKYVVMIDGETYPAIVKELVPDLEQQVFIYFNKAHRGARTNFGENISHSIAPSTRAEGCSTFMAMDAVNMPLRFPNLEEINIYSKAKFPSSIADNAKVFYPSVAVTYDAFYDPPDRTRNDIIESP